MPKLLVIEDELEVSDYLRDYFRFHGVEVLTATSGEEALTLLEDKRPDLVLLDLKLGAGISGLEVLRRVKATRRARAPIVVLTAVDDEDVANLARGLGAVDYITKPIVISDLDRIVLSRLKQN